MTVFGATWNMNQFQPSKIYDVPFFVLHGEKDTQVIAKEHLEVFTKNISPNIKVKTKSYPGLNHMFQPCLTGEANEYAQIEQTISPEVMSDIITFIQEL